VEEAIAQLEEENGVRRSHLAHLTFIGALRLVYAGGRALRRLHEVALLGPGGSSRDDLSVTTVASWDAESDSFRLLESEQAAAALSQRLGLSEGDLRQEIERRGRFLAGLVRDGVSWSTRPSSAPSPFTGATSRRRARARRATRPAPMPRR
jgi:hypothetical protein